MKALNIRIPDDLSEALREESYGSRRSKNQIIVAAIHEFRRNAFVPRPSNEETTMTPPDQNFTKRITIWTDDDGARAVADAINYQIDEAVEYKIEDA